MILGRFVVQDHDCTGTQCVGLAQCLIKNILWKKLIPENTILISRLRLKWKTLGVHLLHWHNSNTRLKISLNLEVSNSLGSHQHPILPHWQITTQAQVKDMRSSPRSTNRVRYKNSQ